jgi:hypothetical protein
MLYDGPKIPRRLLVLLGISASLLVWTRPLSTLWLALIALTVLLFLGNRARLAQRLRERGVQVLIGVLVFVSLGAGVWTLVSNDLGNNSGYYPKGLGLWAATIHSLSLTPSYLSQMVAVFGWWRTPAFPVISWVWGLALGILILVALWRSKPRLALGVLVTMVIVLLVPTALQAPTARKLGFVWSGRYGLAIGAGVPILAALALCATGRLRQHAKKSMVGIVVTLVAVEQVAAHYANMRRYITGDNGPLWYFGHNGWIPPLPAWSLLVSMIVLSTLLAVLTYRVATSNRGLATDGVPASVPAEELVANGRGHRDPADASVKTR